MPGTTKGYVGQKKALSSSDYDFYVICAGSARVRQGTQTGRRRLNLQTHLALDRVVYQGRAVSSRGTSGIRVSSVHHIHDVVVLSSGHKSQCFVSIPSTPYGHIIALNYPFGTGYSKIAQAVKFTSKTINPPVTRYSLEPTAFLGMLWAWHSEHTKESH